MSVTRLGIPCPTSLLFGVQCPTCGATRSLSALLRGDLALSVAYHPCGVLVAVAVLAAIIAPNELRAAYHRIANQLESRSTNEQVAIAVGLFVAVWAWNLQRVIPA